MSETKATCDAIEALHDDEMCSWYMGIDGKYPDDMAAIDLKTLARDYQAVCAERDRLRAVLDAADEIKFKGGDEIFIGTESGLCYSQDRFDTDPANVWKRYGKWSADAVLEAFAALQGDEGGSDE